MRYALTILTALILTGCANQVQTTSGADYLSKYAPTTTAPNGTKIPVVSDKAIRAAAAVEPILQFPARIGVARIENGRLASIPSGEVELWTKLAEKHSALGEFVPVSPVVAEFTAAALLPPKKHDYHRPENVGDLVTKIRLGAARQHVDAVLIYEVASTSRSDNTPLAFADVTIIGGAFLPTRTATAQGLARALLLDVRNGYPYGTATAQEDLSRFSTSWGSDSRTLQVKQRAIMMVVRSLTVEVSEMFDKLKVEMAARTK